MPSTRPAHAGDTAVSARAGGCKRAVRTRKRRRLFERVQKFERVWVRVCELFKLLAEEQVALHDVPEHIQEHELGPVRRVYERVL
jgi:hypothetical protein